ncbi:MAG: hypothetical protein ACOCXJ_00565 [Planctomycetota bacterium]
MSCPSCGSSVSGSVRRCATCGASLLKRDRAPGAGTPATPVAGTPLQQLARIMQERAAGRWWPGRALVVVLCACGGAG